MNLVTPMNDTEIVTQNLDERTSRPALFVLGMHRSGTSAITGALRHSGVWVGEETELTDANVENPLGFWERRDMRNLCDQMLQSAGADWWKIANFDPKAIPRATLAEQRRNFEKIVSELDKYQAWVIKEPRLCLLLPVLRHYVNNPVCIHIYRNPLEVARSLQTRNGFSISAGLALWEVYNLHALKASEGLPRISLSYESLMLHPLETLDALVKELEGLGGEPIKPDSGLVERFIDLGLYRQRATAEETEDYLLPSQRALWLRLRSGEVFDDDLDNTVSEATKQALLDLESVEGSISLYTDKTNELSATLKTREERIGALEASLGLLRSNLVARDERIGALEDWIERLKGSVAERTATLKVRGERIKALENWTERLKGSVAERTATLKVRDERIRALEDWTERLKGSVAERTTTLKVRDERIKALEDSGSRLRSKLELRSAMLKQRDERIGALEDWTERLKGSVEERTAALKAREGRIEALEAYADKLKTNVRERNERIKSLERSAGQLRGRLQARDKTIEDLYSSNSWKITAPLRVLSRCISWLLRNLRRALKLLFWLSTGQFSRAVEAVRHVRAKAREKSIARRAVEQPAVTEQVAKLVREHANRARPDVIRNTAAGEAKARITVITWDLGHNPLGRAYLLADVLRHDYDVELIGAQFPRFGNEVWEPLRNCSRVVINSFPGGNFPGHFKDMEDIARQIDGDVIYVSKPRLPGLELAMLAKLHRNRPVILDVDDYEPGFFRNHKPLTLKQVKRKRHSPDFVCPHDETWTRYAESLIPMFEQVTVSNEELRKKFGGMVLPHIRDEHDFDPTVYPREALRAELGFSREDKVIVFAGTPRKHKGYTRIVAALESLQRPHYKLLIIGSPADDAAHRFFGSIKSGHVKVVPNVPFSDLPGYLCASDLICLLQAEDQVTARFQMPAKLTDGLSMGIPVLATNVAPLVNLAEKGLVELLGDAPLDRKIDEIFSDYRAYKHKAAQNRETFVREYSYGSNLPRLKDIIERVLDNPAPIPDEFRELIAYHRRIFSAAADSPRVTAKVVTAVQPPPVTHPSPPVTGAPVIPARRVDAYVDDKIDIVFFWKQNDTGIYGRRQDMLVKYLAEDPRINRILHFDAPVNIFKSGGDVLKSGQAGRHSHAGLVLFQSLKRIVRPRDQGNVRFDTFVFAGKGHASRFRKWILPTAGDYPDYLDRVMKQQQIGQRRTVFWVCPNNFDFPALADRFKPDLVVSDVIDDQRKWPCSPRYRQKLHHNYREILARTHLAFANCPSVFEDMQEHTDNIHLIPNACELLEKEARHWEKPAQLKRIKGPVIGYAGNLDITRIDLDLLMRVAGEQPDWNLVFIGSMHKSREIRKLGKFSNVHFLGVRVYEQALRYIRHFDVAIIPHLDTELTRSMNPLKLYVYFSLHVPVVSTPIANIGDFRDLVQVGATPEEFIDRIAHCLDNNPVVGNLERVRSLLEANSWNERTTRILKLVGKEFARAEATPAGIAAVSYDKDGYTDCCTVCGHAGYLRREERSIRETYQCGNCGASLRYREQARLILKFFSRENSAHLGELVQESEFRDLRIYEPGLIGPFRKLFQQLPGYCNSYFWEDVKPGEFREEIQCQDLMNLTYEDNSFDLVLSSDIFEHVRKPFVGFQEVNRVLKPGGSHIFSIPSDHPMPSETVYRVDTSGPEDVFVLPGHYHSAPNGGKSLVYTEFGKDMVGTMAADGIDLKMESPAPGSAPASIAEQMLSFYWKK